MGYVVNRGSKDRPKWYGKFKDLDGKWKQKLTRQQTKAAALRVVAEWDARVAKGLVGIVEPTEQQSINQSMTVRDLIERFLHEFSRPKIKDMKAYRASMRHNVSRQVYPHPFASMVASAVRSGDLEVLRNTLQSAGYRNNTINLTLSRLRRIFSWAIDRDIIQGKNPVAKIEMMPWTQSEDHFSREEIFRLLHPINRLPMIATAVYTGMRKGELFGLTWACVRFDLSRIEIRRSYEGATKTGKPRQIPIHAELMPILQEWRKRCPDTEAGLVFPVYRGTLLRMGTEKDMEDLRELLDSAGCHIPERPWHAMRHTFITELNEAGAHPVAIEEIVGHAHHGSKVTAGYTHVGLDFLARELQRLSFACTPEKSDQIERERRVAQEVEKKRGQGPMLLSEAVAALVGYGPTGDSSRFRQFRKRHPDLTKIAIRIGPRLHWPEDELRAWLSRNPRFANRGRLVRLESEGLLSPDRVAHLLGLRRPDGKSSMKALFNFRKRHPEFEKLAVPVGRRKYWPQSAVTAWLKTYPPAIDPDQGVQD